MCKSSVLNFAVCPIKKKIAKSFINNLNTNGWMLKRDAEANKVYYTFAKIQHLRKTCARRNVLFYNVHQKTRLDLFH